MGDWSRGLADGVIVELNIRRYRPSGKSTPSIRKEYDARMKTIETKARNNLRSHSFSCDMLGTHGKFVPIGAYLDFRERNQRLQRDFYQTREKAMEAYARDAEEHERTHGTPPSMTIDDLRKSYEYITVLRQVPSNVRIAAGACSDERVSGLPSMTPPDTCLGEGTLDDATKALADDLVSSVNGQTDIVTTAFMRESSIRLREIAIDAGTRIVESIDRNGTLVGRASIMAHNMVTSIRALDYYGDADMQSAIDAIEGELDGDRDVQRLRSVIDDTIGWASKSVTYLNGYSDTPPKPVRADRHVTASRVRRKGKDDGVIVIPTTKKQRRVRS